MWRVILALAELAFYFGILPALYGLAFVRGYKRAGWPLRY